MDIADGNSDRRREPGRNDATAQEPDSCRDGLRISRSCRALAQGQIQSASNCCPSHTWSGPAPRPQPRDMNDDLAREAQRTLTPAKVPTRSPERTHFPFHREIDRIRTHPSGRRRDDGLIENAVRFAWL